MKRVCLLILMILLLSACGTKRHEMTYIPDESAIPGDARYCVAPAVDDSGFTFEANEEEVDIRKAMGNALTAKLKEEGLYSETAQDAFSIRPTVTRYKPGNAFGRWLMPGVGSTEINVSSTVSNPEGKAIGEIKTKNSIDAGGAFAIGAWEYIFEHAAAGIVKELKESMGLAVKTK